jgi:vacuolar-type H+-ATPase subunit I/STV1
MPRLEKGSAAAKERMVHLRSLRKKKVGEGSDSSIPIEKMEIGKGGVSSALRRRNRRVAPIQTANLITDPEDVIPTFDTEGNSRNEVRPALIVEPERNREEKSELQQERATVNSEINELNTSIKKLQKKIRNHENGTKVMHKIDYNNIRQSLHSSLSQKQDLQDQLDQINNILSEAIEVEGSGLKKKSPWIKFVTNYAKQHNMSFFTALKTDEVKKQYHSQK